MLDTATIFSGAARIEGVHPLQFGFVRRKVRTQRRPDFRCSIPLVFYPRRLGELAIAGVKWFRLSRRINAIARRVVEDPASAHYVDEALLPPRGQ